MLFYFNVTMRTMGLLSISNLSIIFLNVPELNFSSSIFDMYITETN